ncbi:hypothetical protein K488DRAFT_53668 [Vararia minispora EC-137]|uniref:Uncharacterized protein n=1 Tax=Vararia minispora EC-137 TaxID=1314806 RepID=A0ACB8QGA8_9AGAM|nr:hypothetical protein K488DRAFT_53668 [Vararia minispora EC-137]
MPFVRRHVTRRLKSAKQECDKGLQRITDSVTAFFEDRLRDALRADEEVAARRDHERDLERNAADDRSLLDRGRNRDSLVSDRDVLRDAFHSSFSDTFVNPPDNRRASRVLIDDPVDPIMANLFDLTSLATEVVDMSVAQLTADPKVCERFVQRLQAIGKAWEDHPEWHGRSWYVQVLLAFASLSRVVEWYEAEKQFWNFDDNDDEQDESLLFVLKPADDERAVPLAPSPRLSVDEESKYRLSRPVSQGKRSREDVQQQQSSQTHLSPPATEGGSTSAAGSRPASLKALDTAESARAFATERLRLQAETAQNRNIVLELELDGDHVLWLNYAWFVVVGTDPDQMRGKLLSPMLAEEDATVFHEATQRLQEDDSHTVEVRFHLRVEPEEEAAFAAGQLYQLMEGKGMLMFREDGSPTHTMWVIKPIDAPVYSQPVPDDERDAVGDRSGTVGPADAQQEQEQQQPPASPPPAPLPFARPINMTPILCRICENSIAQWYFEKHNETCSETHRLEAEIGECNESISELRNTIRDLFSALERASPAQPPEYRGLPILGPSSSPGSSSPLQLFRFNKLQKLGLKKLQRRLLEQLDDVLQLAAEIAVPALKEEEQKEPIERQRLLSPSSERKITQIRNWSKPATTDGGLAQLVADAERVMRQKIDTVVRLQNTIRYSEKVRQEWEERVGLALEEESSSDESEGSEECGEEGEGEGNVTVERDAEQQHDDDHSSTTSEYAFGGGGGGSRSSTDPTPMASVSPFPQPVAEATPSITPALPISPTPLVGAPPPLPSQLLGTPSSSYSSMIMMPPPPPPPHYPRQGMTRSSTPSSVSSPLALAAPIVASHGPDDGDDNPPFMDLNEPAPMKLRVRKSAHNLQPTPPISPLNSPLELPGISRKSHRRHSTINPVVQSTGLPPSAGVAGAPLSPRIQTTTPAQRNTPTSIKDFEIIKPISKGAFGAVFLAKKKATGDYYAIKVLRKADMIAKNQVTNVKAERMILMKQAESSFVAKLYFTFQSKENLYLVMEYLNGGDCAALIKSLGMLPEEWTKQYIAEVVLGLESLHQRGITHRDLKPDNLLINQQGHLKLTDFGLSKIGLLGRHTREGPANLSSERDRALSRSSRTRYSPHSRPPSMDSGHLSSPLIPSDLIGGGSYFNQQPAPFYRHATATNSFLSSADDVSESSGSDVFAPFFAPSASQQGRGGKTSSAGESPLQSFASELTNDLRSHPMPGSGTPPGEQKFVGTPDYLAPETILGLSGDDSAVDWWALGVITYEFLYGAPPFHDETPEKVFENILSGRVDWMEEYVDYSHEARDFMERLLTLDPARRLGADGADEVKAHPWFAGVEWDKVTTAEAAFIPQVTDPESTDYFDPRGAILQLFQEEEHAPSALGEAPVVGLDMQHAHAPAQGGKESAQTQTPADEEFGTFSFKNLPVLKQANDEVIRKLRTDQMAPITHTLSDSTVQAHARKRSTSTRKRAPANVVTALDGQSVGAGKPALTSPPSPATSTSSIASSPSRGPSTPGSAASHMRKPSEFGAVERFKHNHMESDLSRRNSMPSRLRTASVSSSMGEGSTGSEGYGGYGMVVGGHLLQDVASPPSSVASVDLKRGPPEASDRAVTCLLAEDNPITAKIIETLLIRLGCRCVVVVDGSEAISVALGDIKFDCILMDLHMPVVDGESAARYIKSTNNKNTRTPIIAVSAYSGTDSNEASALFAASLSKPLQKADLLNAMRQLGFKTSSVASDSRRGAGVKAATTVLGR